MILLCRPTVWILTFMARQYLGLDYFIHYQIIATQSGISKRKWKLYMLLSGISVYFCISLLGWMCSVIHTTSFLIIDNPIIKILGLNRIFFRAQKVKYRELLKDNRITYGVNRNGFQEMMKRRLEKEL